MKSRELRQKSADELRDLLNEKRLKLNELKFMLSQKKVKNVKEVGYTKKDIARILTTMKFRT